MRLGFWLEGETWILVSPFGRQPRVWQVKAFCGTAAKSSSAAAAKRRR